MTFKILPQVTLVLFGKLGEEVDRLIGLCQFLRQLPYLLFQQLYLPRLRIVISYADRFFDGASRIVCCRVMRQIFDAR